MTLTGLAAVVLYTACGTSKPNPKSRSDASSNGPRARDAASATASTADVERVSAAQIPATTRHSRPPVERTAEPVAAAAFPVEIPYSISKAGEVSMAVYDERGRLLRTLKRADREEAGAHSARWDGLDRDGNPLPPGMYEWRALRKPTLKAEYLLSLGVNPGSKPYDQWVGCHGGACSVAVDGSGMYVAAEVTETAPVLMKQSMDGTERLWTQGRGGVTEGRFQGGSALASDGRGTLYMLQQNGYLQPIDAATGGLKVDKYRRKGRWDPLPKDVTSKIKKREQVRFRYRSGLNKVAGADIAARGGTLVISFHEQNSVRWLSTKDASVVEHEVEVPEPYGVAVGPDERVYVISQRKVLDVDPRKGIVRTVIGAGLVAPRRLAVDAAGRHILVAEQGDCQQVKRFAMNGRLVATYGREGGRREGRYVSQDFFSVNDIEGDGRGGFVVAEPHSGARRVAHFDRDGKPIHEWYGGQPYYAWGEPDPEEPSKVWFNPGSWLALAAIDYEAGTWRVLETYRVNAMAGGFVHQPTSHQGRWRAVALDGKRYLVAETDGQILAHEDGRLRPVSVTGRLDKKDHKAKVLKLSGGRGADAQSYRWLDANRDGEPQPDEFTFDAESSSTVRDGWVTDEMAFVSCHSYKQDDGSYLLRVAETKPMTTDVGPAYPIGSEDGLNEIVATKPVDSGFGHRGSGAFGSRKGGYLAHVNHGRERHGSSWPTEWGGKSRLICWDAAGTELWSVGRHAIHGGLGGSPHTTPNEYMHVPAEMIGETELTVIMADRVENIAMNWTRDGLYAGDFFDGRVDDGLPDKVYYWWRTPDGKEAIATSDNAQGGRAIQRADGTVLWFVQGRNSIPVYRVHGWDGWERMSGAITLASEAPHATGDGTGLTAEYFRGAAITDAPDVRRVDTQVWCGIPRRKPGNDAIMDGFDHGPTYDWSGGVEPLGVKTEFAVRWSGRLEAPVTESFVFSVYAAGRVRLWVDGTQRIFNWNQTRGRLESAPLELAAGKRYDVQLDFATTRQHPKCSLNWESYSLDRERIPQKNLFPDMKGAVARKPDARPATAWIEASSFDGQSGDIGSGDVGSTVAGLRQRGFGVTGSYLAYERIDFARGVSRLRVNASGKAAGKASFDVTLGFHLDGPGGPRIAVVAFGADDKGEHVVDVEGVNGSRDVFVVNESPKKWHFVNFRRFRFE